MRRFWAVVGLLLLLFFGVSSSASAATGDNNPTGCGSNFVCFSNGVPITTGTTLNNYYTYCIVGPRASCDVGNCGTVANSTSGYQVWIDAGCSGDGDSAIYWQTGQNTTVPLQIVPVAPASVTVTAITGTAIISFPVVTAAAPVVNYSISITPGGAVSVCSGPPCTITGLAIGTTYTFSVQARNAVGLGAAAVSSAVAVGVTPTVTATATIAVPTPGPTVVMTVTPAAAVSTVTATATAYTTVTAQPLSQASIVSLDTSQFDVFRWAAAFAVFCLSGLLVWSFSSRGGHE